MSSPGRGALARPHQVGGVSARLLSPGAGALTSLSSTFSGAASNRIPGGLAFFGTLASLVDPAAFARRQRALRQIDWVVYAKPPFGGPEQVLAYLGRYTHRVAIANSRLATLDDTQVGFRWKDYRHHGKTKVMTLAPAEFIRRFLQHTLPDGFYRIRHYGLLANTHRAANLAICRRLLAAPPPVAPPPTDYRDRYHQLTGRRLDICPCCGGTMEPIGPLPRSGQYQWANRYDTS